MATETLSRIGSSSDFSRKAHSRHKSDSPIARAILFIPDQIALLTASIVCMILAQAIDAK